MKYEILVNIIDRIRQEAPPRFSKKYYQGNDDIDSINASRSRAFIHLFLKVSFGILNFEEREHFITDGSYDGGIDGYYLDGDTKTIYLIQSKFRASQKNFEEKEISFDEILSMDIDRILDGEISDESGNEYNGKIKQLQREYAETPDVGRYRQKVIILANLKDIKPSNLKKLTGGYSADVFDFTSTYSKLVLPVISGTYFTASDISIPIDLSNKNAGAKISYTVKTRVSDCEITVLFVPTIEIAKIMKKYKNSILRYNPRSFLDLAGQAVNRSIRDTILNSDTNEFALFNNGITMLSDETYINEKIGQKNKAQLTVMNPQIINGGQTSYTLSQIYDENAENADNIFNGKEVLLKIITLIDNKSHSEKMQLIEEISNATNKQTPVITADRFSNEALHVQIQKVVFDRYGLLYERKRGEFYDGIKEGYIDSKIVIERNHLLRILYSANGVIRKGSQKKLFQSNKLDDINVDDVKSFDRFYIGYQALNAMLKGEKMPGQKAMKGIYGRVSAYVLMFEKCGIHIKDHDVMKNVKMLDAEWKLFLDDRCKNGSAGRRLTKDRITGETKAVFSEVRYYRSGAFERDVVDYFMKWQAVNGDTPTPASSPPQTPSH